MVINEFDLAKGECTILDEREVGHFNYQEKSIKEFLQYDFLVDYSTSKKLELKYENIRNLEGI